MRCHYGYGGESECEYVDEDGNCTYSSSECYFDLLGGSEVKDV